MKVIEPIEKEKTALSFEFFPPKTTKQEKHLFDVISKLKKFKPDFASVTYGALGTTREKSFEVVSTIKKKYKIEPVAHLTCVAATKEKILEQLDELEGIGVENILALRGDPPEGHEKFIPPKDGFKYASELVAFIKKHKQDFCVGVAGYPEGHFESADLNKDVKNLKLKIDAGAEYIISQLFFDNRYFFDFVDRCRKTGINVPIIPGIMQITSLKQIKKFTSVCGATIPSRLLKELEKYDGDNEVVSRIGAEQAIDQCKELLKNNVPGLHFFVMNQAEPISRVLKELKI